MNNWLVLLVYTFTCINTSAFVFQALVHFRYIDDRRWRDNLRTTALVYCLPLLGELSLSWAYTGIASYSFSNILLVVGFLTCIPCWHYQRNMYDDASVDDQDKLIIAALLRSIAWVIRLAWSYILIVTNM